jgi:hypothetical protein
MTTTTPTPEAAPPSSPLPQLAPVLAQFQSGDVRGARAAARALTTHAQPEVAAAARAFLTETDTDPMAFAAALVALGVLALVTSAYLF